MTTESWLTFDERARQAWDRVMARVRSGDHPTGVELAEIIGRYGVPGSEVVHGMGGGTSEQHYVARRLRDEIHLGDGGRPTSEGDTISRALDAVLVVNQVEDETTWLFATDPSNATKDRAWEMVARRRGGISGPSLKRKVQRDLKNTPPDIRDSYLESVRLAREGGKMQRAMIKAKRAEATAQK